MSPRSSRRFSPSRSARRPLLLALAAVALLALTGGSPRLTAEEPPQPDSLFVERVDVNVVNVEVFVTDDKGRHVTGLTRDDFEILQDGDPVAISNFFTVSRQNRLEAELARSGGRAGEPAPTGDLPEDQKLNLMVYVDHFNLRPGDRTRVLDQLDGFLEDRMFQGDRVMVVGYDGQLDVAQPFTGEHAKIDQALRRMEKVKAGRLQYDAQRATAVQNIRTFVEAGQPEMAYSVVKSYVQEQRTELRRSLAALATVVRSLAGLPGRKALLYVSDGLPRRPGEELYEILRIMNGSGSIQVGPGGANNIDLSSDSLAQDESHAYGDIIRHANAHQVTLYTVDASGPGGDSTFSAAESSTLIEGGGRTAIDAMSTINMQESLLGLANSTGGTAVLGTYDFADAFERTAADFDRFYSLGFVSPAAGDGEYHAIEVRVKRPGLRVRHRSGYIDKPEVEQVADRTYSSLILDMESNPLGVQVEFGEPERKGRQVYHLPILVRIPFRDVTLLPNGANEEGRLRIFLAVKDEQGGVSDLVQYTYPLKVPTEQLADVRGKEIGYSAILKISPGTPKVAVGVWDELSGTESFVHKQVLVERRRG